jgi:hypothetical protein
LRVPLRQLPARSVSGQGLKAERSSPPVLRKLGISKVEVNSGKTYFFTAIHFGISLEEETLGEVQKRNQVGHCRSRLAMKVKCNYLHYLSCLNK